MHQKAFRISSRSSSVVLREAQILSTSSQDPRNDGDVLTVAHVPTGNLLRGQYILDVFAVFKITR